jgi:hypothetical protein
MDNYKKSGIQDQNPETVFSSGTPRAHEEYEKKLRRRIEDRIRKDKEALHLVARVLNIK